jgi:hypothetical protein
MIGDQRPGVTKRFTVADNPGQALDEIIAIIVIKKKLPPFYPPADDMVQGAGRIDSCFSWHFDYISSPNGYGNAYFHPRPHFPQVKLMWRKLLKGKPKSLSRPKTIIEQNDSSGALRQ